MIQTNYKKTRWTVLLTFFLVGASFSTWGSRIPEIQAHLSLSDGQLGITLLGVSLGVVLALLVADTVIGKFGSRKVILVAGVLSCVFLPLLAIAPSMILLWVLLFFYGACHSMVDVAMNDQAVMTEKGYQKPLMSSFHAAYSIGALAGALLGSLLARFSFFVPFYHFLLVAVLFGITFILSQPFLMDSEKREKQIEKKSPFKLPEKALWLLGLIAFSSSIGEGSMADWSAVYMSSTLFTTASIAALGYAAFSVTMTLGRLLGDWITKNLGATRVVKYGSLISFVGLLVLIFTHSPYVAMLGFAAAGIGLANIVPIAFSAAGNREGIHPSEGIAGVASIGYAGFLAGPPIIGFIAQSINIRFAFMFVAVMIGSLFFLSKAIHQK